MLGDQILSTLERLRWPSPAAILIRHSERPHISSAIGTNDVPLTAAGVEAALHLGFTLAQHHKRIRLFHSPVLRCAQTAEHIQAGAARAGVAAHEMGHRNCLGGSCLANPAVALRLADQLGQNFVRTWFDGGIDPAIMKPLRDSLTEHIAYLLSELLNAEPATLDVHITHDWNVMLFREGLFGVRHDHAGWPDFLEGIVLQHADDHSVVSYRDSDTKQTCSRK